MLGVILLNYKKYSETIDCARQLKNQIDACDRIYIVDNASGNESVETLRETFGADAQIAILESDRNGGFSYGNNIGFRRAVADGCTELLCSNSDIRFDEDCVAHMRAKLASHPEVAVVGPKIFTPDGGLQKCNKTKLTAFRFAMHHKPLVWLDVFGVNKRYGMLNYAFDRDIVFDGMVSGCCFLIRADVLEQIGYLDEGVFLYHEEDILGAKLRQRGWKVMVATDATIVHYGAGSIGAVSAFTRYCTFASAFYYLWQYANTGKCAMKLLLSWARTMFGLKSGKDPDYKKYSKQLKRDVMQLIATERITE